MLTTVTLQIGNSDDKLTQYEWSRFVTDIKELLWELSVHTHFSGSSPGHEPWQNYCFVFETKEEDIPYLKKYLTEIRKEYKQDSVAYTEGTTELI